jgi:hypothetical protein
MGGEMAGMWRGFLEGRRASGSQVGAGFLESEEGDDGSANWIFYPAVVGGRVSETQPILISAADFSFFSVSRRYHSTAHADHDENSDPLYVTIDYITYSAMLEWLRSAEGASLSTECLTAWRFGLYPYQLQEIGGILLEKMIVGSWSTILFGWGLGTERCSFAG